MPSRLVNLDVSSELLEPDNVIEGKKSLLEILRSDFDTLIFSLSAFNSGLFWYASLNAWDKLIAKALEVKNIKLKILIFFSFVIF